MNILPFRTLGLTDTAAVVHRHHVYARQINPFGLRIVQYIQTVIGQTCRQNRQRVPDPHATTFRFPLILRGLNSFVTAVNGVMVGNPGPFDIEVQHVQVEVFNDVIIVLLQL